MCIIKEELRFRKPIIFSEILTNEQKILQLLKSKHGKFSKTSIKRYPSHLPKALFAVFIQVMSEGAWTYNPEKSDRVEILKRKYGAAIEVDCYDLSRAFIKVLFGLGLKRADAFEKVYAFKLSKRLGEQHLGVEGEFQCFDEKENDKFSREDYCFFFDNHAVAKVFDRYYDLTFKCHYDHEEAIFDTSARGKIFSAAASNDLVTMRQLFQKYPDFEINETDNRGLTLLHWAAIHMNVEMASFLIHKNINPNIRNRKHEIPLQLVDDPDSAFYVLLEKHTDNEKVRDHLEHFTTNSKSLSGFSAIKDNNFQGLKYLLRPERGLDVNHVDDSRMTLLHWVANYNRYEMGELLLSLGADPNIKNDFNLCPIEMLDDPNSPLFTLLATKTKTEIVEHKLHQYYELQPKSVKLKLAFKAIEGGDDATVLKLLLSGLDVNDKDSRGFSLFYYASIHGREALSVYLLKHGAVSSRPHLPGDYPLEQKERCRI